MIKYKLQAIHAWYPILDCTLIFNYSKVVIIVLLIIVAFAFMATVIGLAVNRPISCPTNAGKKPK